MRSERTRGRIRILALAAAILAAGVASSCQAEPEKTANQPGVTVTTVPLSAATTDVATATPTVTVSTVATAVLTADLERRVVEWLALLQLVGDTGQDKTAELAGFLAPKDQAKKKAAEYQKNWTAKPNKTDPIAKSESTGIVRITLSGDGKSAVVLKSDRITGQDKLVTSGLQVMTWTKLDGEWYRTIAFQPSEVNAGGKHPIDESTRVGDLTWSPTRIVETKDLVVGDNMPQTPGMFLTVDFSVMNGGKTADVLDTYSVSLYDKDGTEFKASETADQFFSDLVTERKVSLDPGTSRTVLHFFEVPKGLDLATLEYEIRPLGD
jgi:Domain of unknown function (DUF4352)